MQHNKISSKQIFSLSLLFFAMAFYVIFAFVDGVDVCNDSNGYMIMDVAREPFYPLLLALFRSIFGEGETYLFATILFQSILAGFATWSITFFLTKKLSLSKLETLVIYALPFMVSLLCRFGAQRAAMYSNSILTEGITFSLFLIFFRYLLEYVIDQTKKSAVISILLAIILISTRKQMMICLLLIIVAILLVMILRKTWLKSIVSIVVAAILILLCTQGIDYYYNYTVRGVWARHTSDTRFITTVGYYVMDEEDLSNIEEDSIRELAADIYTTCTDGGYTFQSVKDKNWSAKVEHYMNNYDLIQINTMWPSVQEYVRNVENVPEHMLNYRTDEILNEMNNAFFFTNIPAVLDIFQANFRYGMVTTIAQKHTLLNWYSLIAYLGFIGLLIIRLFRLKKNPSKGNVMCCLFGVLVLFSILLNVSLVAAVIFCQPRYTIYNMALFYMAGFLLLKNRE